MPLALIIDDEVDLCRLMQMTLKKMQIDCVVAYDVATAKDYLSKQSFDFCLTDLRLPDGTGMDIVKLIVKDYPQTPVAVITAHGSVDLGVEALKLGAFDFVSKPLELPKLRSIVENALKVNENKKNQNDNEPPKDPFAEKLVGNSTAIHQLKQTIQKLARSQAPVFLWGESGSGKEVVAKMIHELSPRHQSSFVAVNCGAIPSELMESEFFGHKKGSFTGATSDKEGLFQQANGGTLFLDEVADLPLAMQVKLLRAIQEKKVRPIGGTQEMPVDIRLLSATHKDLAKLVEKGDFRQDLYYRINVIEVKLPSLNDRKDDIPLLAEHFLQLIAKDWGMDSPAILTTKASFALLSHHYSGNVRELRNILERAITLSDGHLIDVEHLNLKNHATPADSVSSFDAFSPPVETIAKPVKENPPTSYTTGIFNTQTNSQTSVNLNQPNDTKIQTLPNIVGKAMSFGSSNHETPAPAKSILPDVKENDDLPAEGLEEYLCKQEKRLIMTALKQTDGNKTNAAKKLGMSFRSLRYRMSKLGLNDNDDD